MRMVLIPERVVRVGLVLAFTVAAASCGSSSEERSSSTSTTLPVLVATTSIWADIASNVACGEPVDALIPAGADPHVFEPSLATREHLDHAGVVIANGGGLEEGLNDMIATVEDQGVPVIEMTDFVDLRPPSVHDTDTDNDHGGIDPHIWQDPMRVADTLEPIAEAIIAAGRNPANVHGCEDDYRDELVALDSDITSLLAPIPAERRVMVTNHDAFGYFADRYHLEIVGTVIPSLSTLGEASAGELAKLADVIDQRHVPAIFTEEFAATTDANALADRLHVKVIPLDSDALTTNGPAATYLGMMRSNAQTITDALS
jgi:zinc/manganese transport system substrate-binding protein